MVARRVEIEPGELACIADCRCVFAACGEWRRHNFGTIYRHRISGTDCGDCPDLYCDSRLGDGNHAQTSTNNLAWVGGWFRRRWRFARASPAFLCKRWTASRIRNVNPARVLLHLVGGIALFTHSKTRCLAISDGGSTDALRWTTPFG